MESINRSKREINGCGFMRFSAARRNVAVISSVVYVDRSLNWKPRRDRGTMALARTAPATTATPIAIHGRSSIVLRKVVTPSFAAAPTAAAPCEDSPAMVSTRLSSSLRNPDNLSSWLGACGVASSAVVRNETGVMFGELFEIISVPPSWLVLTWLVLNSAAVHLGKKHF